MARRLLGMLSLAIAITLVSQSAVWALTREEIVTRGQHWVELGVPYSQTSTFEGYRQDCSGMASMTWKLSQPGPPTSSLAAYGAPIVRDDLQPGDMLLAAGYHATIFYKWANAEHTSYWALEESSSAGKAVQRVVPYPHWPPPAGYTYRPYRPLNVTELDDYDDYIEPIAGADRYRTAIEASRHAFEDGSASTAIVCSGENWPDALGGSALAGSMGAPILLTGSRSLPADLGTELTRLGATDVIVIGGSSAVATSVADAIGDLSGIEHVSRIGGKDRYETAALVARETVRERDARLLTNDGGAYLATGASFPDALGAAAAAAHTGRPVLLARSSSLPTVTADAIRDLGIDSAYIAGGTGALSSAVEVELTSMGVEDIERFAGVDRYETSLLLAEHAVNEGLEWRGIALATGVDFADALAGAVMQARAGSVLVLTPSRHLSPSTDAAIRHHLDEVEVVTVLGGEAAVSRLARRQIRWIIDEP